MEQTECSEMSAYKIQTLGNYPEESIQHSGCVESLKSQILLVSLYCNVYVALNFCVLMILSLLFVMFLLNVCNFVTYSFDLIAQGSSFLSVRIPHSVQLVRMMDPWMCMYVPFLLLWIMMYSLLLGMVLSIFTCWFHNVATSVVVHAHNNVHFLIFPLM